ncbi:MAG: hypothetical protein E6L06_00655 [Verrucomicrobia bacterium]|nr:MAG: hypothetical protein E6L06_00655 [Verrucomicrobiota bacterium]
MPAQDERGTTLVEVAVAGALLVFALASLYALYGTTVKEAKGGDTAAIAEQNSIARIDPDSISKSDAGLHSILFGDQDRHRNTRHQSLCSEQHPR